MGRHSLHLVDAAVVGIVGAVAAAGVVVRGDPDSRPLALALALSAAAVLVARRPAPVATLVASGALVLALFAVDHGAGAAAVVAPAVALYAVGLIRGRAHQVVAAAAAVGAVAAADTAFAGHAPRLATFGHIALVAIPLLAAEALRARRAYVSVLLERLALAEQTREEEARRRVEQERLRIARELHDVAAHTLTTINVQAGVAAHLVEREPEHARTALAAIEDSSREALDELRGIVGVLRDGDAEGAPVRPAPTLGDLDELIVAAREGGTEVRLERVGTPPDRLPDAVQLAAFRIVQESLTNARRHAPGSGVSVELTFEPDRLRVEVESGAGAPGDANGAGAGIAGMRERALALGGALEAGPSRDGFRVEATLPYRREP